MNADKAGPAYWNELWASQPPNTESDAPSPMMEWLRKAVANLPAGSKILEVGCANSAYLPFFAKLGFSVSGLDYSAVGCERTREHMSRLGLSIDIECADLFAPPERFVGIFDAVVSLGVIEHFEDGCATLQALTRMLRPGGLLLTAVPNLRGIQGAFQWLFDPSNISKHILYSQKQLVEVHAAAGLHVVESRYLGRLDLHCVNPGAAGRIKSLAFAAMCKTNRLLWTLGMTQQGRLCSPHLVCAAVRP